MPLTVRDLRPAVCVPEMPTTAHAPPQSETGEPDHTQLFAQGSATLEAVASLVGPEEADGVLTDRGPRRVQRVDHTAELRIREGRRRCAQSTGQKKHQLVNEDMSCV